MKKIIIFISGTVLLSAAWMGVTSSVKSSQDSIQQEAAPVKFGLVQSRWEKLAGFEALKDGALVKPVEFVFRFGMDFDLMESKVGWSIASGAYRDVKRAYLDAGLKTMFFTLNLKNRGPYLVRMLKINGEVEATGFPLDTMLNYLGQGLERDEWFLIDGKRRVVASSEKSYVGESYKIGGNFKQFKFDVLGKDYVFATLNPKGVNLALVNFMGICGICLISFALYIYTDGTEGGQAVFANDSSLEDGLFKDLSLDRDSAYAPLEQKTSREKFFEDSISEDMRMVDLTATTLQDAGSTSGEGVKLDYTEFLIENPLLGEAPSFVGLGKVDRDEAASEVLERAVESGALPEVSTADDWVKLAEDLSANIDKFTQALGDGNSPKGSESEIEKANV